MPKRRTSEPLPYTLRTRGTADLMLMRSVVGFLGTWALCERACRRHQRCMSPDVACFDRNRALIRAELEALAAWPRLDGPRPQHEEDGPVGRLYD